MDRIDKELLFLLQFEFPLVARPFEEFARKVGISEEEVIDRVKQLVRDGVVRRIGAVLDAESLELEGALVALHVPDDRVDEVAEIINSFNEVTHNYQRYHYFNIWFTVISENRERLEEILEEIRRKARPERMELFPAVRKFKLDARFKPTQND